mmetsp:Transcript_238/g.487  ORF Transcript_238/g.487 Transcript_238/m.487 type:complete len:277 (+) Transcript_238:120-950(+)
MGTASSSGKGPAPQTGKETIKKKIASAHKTGVLNLADQRLKSNSSSWALLTADALAPKLKTLDISGNQLKALPVEIYLLSNLKSLFASNCSIQYTNDLSGLEKLTNLKLDHNDLEVDKIAALPASLLMLNLSSNHLSGVPSILHTALLLTKLDISYNRLESLVGIECLLNLTELNCDDNLLAELPESMGLMVKLRHLTAKRNKLSKRALTHLGQSIPPSLLANTALDNLELTGNPIRKEEVLHFEGVESFLVRRKATKDKNFAGGGLVEVSIFGLD